MEKKLEQKFYYAPAEILKITIEKGMAKANTPVLKQSLLAFLAGAFIAFAAASSNMAAYGLFLNPETYGLGKFVAGLVFPVGLMFVVMAGGELFTGNNLLAISLYDKKIKLSAMLKNWCIVYLGNFVGAMLIVYFIIKTGHLKAGSSLLAGVTIKIAASKVSLGFVQALFLGIMCNWIVCLAVWLCYGAKDMTGKIFSAFFPILLFVTAGFEHSIANMYYIPVGIFAKSIPEFAIASKLGDAVLSNLTWYNFIVKNLIPVTIGNIIGGTVFVGLIYWLCYKKNLKN